MRHFTDLVIKALPPGKHFDASTPAFGMRVGKHRKTWIVQRGAERRIIRVGHYPQMSLQEARAKGRQLLASTQLDHDRVSFEDAYTLFKKTHLPRLRDRTQHDYLRFLDRYYAPTLSKRRLDAITSHMVLAITDELVGTPAEQSHAIAVGKTFFKWCCRRNYLNHSPLEGATLPKQQSRDRVLTDDELVAVWRAAEHLGGVFGRLVRVLILTGLRRAECAAIQTSWIKSSSSPTSSSALGLSSVGVTSLDTDPTSSNLWTITIPAKVTKNGREHSFPICKLSVFLLTSSKIIPQSTELCFPARLGQNQPFSGFSQSKKNLDKLLNIAPWTLHDLRRSYCTKLAELGVAPFVIEKLVNHQTGTLSPIAKIYNRATYFEEMKAAVLLWENRLSSLLGR